MTTFVVNAKTDRNINGSNKLQKFCPADIPRRTSALSGGCGDGDLAFNKPIDDPAFDPTEAAAAVEAEEAEVSAMFLDFEPHILRQVQFLERGNGDKRIVAGGELGVSRPPGGAGRVNLFQSGLERRRIGFEVGDSLLTGWFVPRAMPSTSPSRQWCESQDGGR